jgi:hypothetical protein
MAPISIDCRNDLFAAFSESLDAMDCLTTFNEKTLNMARAYPLHTDYIHERIPRFERVLKDWTNLRSTSSDLERDLKLGALLFNAGLFFDCHEYLERAWKRSGGDEKIMIQGLIQAAAGFHKLELGSLEGGAELLDHAIEKLSKTKNPKYDALRIFAIDIQNSKEEIWNGQLVERKVPQLRYG